MPTLYASQTSAVVNKTGNVRIKITWRRVRLTIVAVEKRWVLHTLSVSAALIMHHAIQYAVLKPMSCPALPYFYTLSHKWTVLR